MIEKTPASFDYGNLADLYIEYMKRSEPFTMPNDHFHDYYEIYYLLSGKRIYFVHDRSYPVEQGDLIFISRQVVHKTLYAGEASHERVIIHFDHHFPDTFTPELRELLLSPFEQHIHVLRLPRQEQLVMEQLIRRLLEEIQQCPPGYELYPPIAVTELLLHAARYLQKHEFVPLSHATPMHAKITEIVRYINHHFSEEIRLSAIAEQFYISSYYLSRIFKEITGFSFSTYLTITRIKEAQRLLRETDQSITEIAAATGFDNFSHFGKTFKKVTRLSPRDYRKHL
ncbi:AraC family transcriptional regulator [Paenibacillus sp. Leaf72]|uniref:AraC family transcriptional regulator n=1 Tax=Paenibacillus sp. Leaf72 TaxID=1736234 RepID=UPI0006F6D817|nr:AraC family transcriptional regulator [Paenibacillus sp. Leaf72]KQN96081.1 hypothetical protein ASF12_24955 [Paenibacillus sp. Leaf72]